MRKAGFVFGLLVMLAGLAGLSPAARPAWAEDEISLDELELAEDAGEEVELEPTGETEADVDLGEVEVAGEAVMITEAPATAVEQVITAEEIERSGAQTLDELLSGKTGFIVTDTFAGQDVTYQGLPSKFTSILVDGQRVPGHILERFDFSQLPLANIERIEVVRGPQAAAYGVDNAGFAVNLITKESATTGGSLTLGLGSLGYNQEQLSLYGGGDTSWLFSLERRQRDAYDLSDLFPDTDGDAYEQFDVFGKLSTELGRGRLSLMGDWFSEDADGLSYSPPDQIRRNEYATRRSQLSASYDLDLGDRQSLNLSYAHGTYKHDLLRYWIDYPDTARVATGFRETTNDVRAGYLVYGDDYLLNAGVSGYWDRLASDRIAGVTGSATAQRIASHLTAEWYLNDHWTAMLSLRHDEHDEFGGHLAPKASVTYQPRKGHTLSVAAGQGFRAPSLKERYYEFASPFGYTVIGNGNLEEETTWSYNFDYEYSDQTTDFRLGSFHHRVENLIVFSEIESSPQIFQTQNVSDAAIDGIQLAAERRWDLAALRAKRRIAWAPHLEEWVLPEYTPTWLGMGLDGTWLIRAEDRATGNRLPSSPDWDHRVRLFYERGPFDGDISVRFTGSRYLDQENTTKAPSYTTVDLSVGRRLPWGKARLSVLNLFDEYNGRFGPEPGLEVRAEIVYDL